MSNEYFPIHPQILRIDTKLTFDVFVKTGTDKYNCLFHSGKQYTAIIHAKIFKHSIPVLYVNSRELEKYFTYLEENFSLIFQDMLISEKSKARIIHELITSLAKHILKNPNAGIIKRYKKIVSKLANYIFENKDAVKYLISLTSSSYSDYNHLVNVGIYSMGLLKEILTEINGHNIAEIAAGFFLHDIGIYNIPKHISQKNSRLTDEEWNIIKKHPEEGYNLLKKLNLISDEIKTIILQHHERHNGNGYPLGLKGDQIHTYSKICSIADIFDALTSNRPYRPAKSSFNALQTMKNEMKMDFDPKLFSQFVLLFSRQRAAVI